MNFRAIRDVLDWMCRQQASEAEQEPLPPEVRAPLRRLADDHETLITPTITPEDLYRHAATAYESESNLFQCLSLSKARMEQFLRLWPGVAANS